MSHAPRHYMDPTLSRRAGTRRGKFPYHEFAAENHHARARYHPSEPRLLARQTTNLLRVGDDDGLSERWRETEMSVLQPGNEWMHSHTETQKRA